MFDFKKHNQEVRELWGKYRAGSSSRVPVIFGIATRYTIFNHQANTRRIDFFEYSNTPDIMFEWQLYHQHWVRHNIIQDMEMGLPEKGWTVFVDFQNYYEAGWFGCDVHYYPGQVPDTRPILSDDKKNMLFDRGIPDPFKDGIMGKNMEYYLYFKNRARNYRYYDLPVLSIIPSGLGTDGPFTVAANLRGASELMIDMIEDPDYVNRLLKYITESTILRIKSWRNFLDREKENHKPDPIIFGFSFADDSIALISPEFYKRFVLPYHRQLIDQLTFDKTKPNAIHLCGDSAKHFKTIRDELNVMSFDTGYPVEFTDLRNQLGPEVEILGGPNIQFLLNGTLEQVKSETKRILQSGILKGKKFILREGNNLAPYTPKQNLEAMYFTARETGKYSYIT